ncbi:hypothetical protein MTO96_030954, partial [Rhipicephalus appendiculatus]
LSASRWIGLVERCVVASAAVLAVIIFVFGFGSFGDQRNKGRHQYSGNLSEVRTARAAHDELSLIRNWSFVLTFWHERRNNGKAFDESAFFAAADNEYDEAKGQISLNITVNGTE